jgi:hypothetical protein
MIVKLPRISVGALAGISLLISLSIRANRPSIHVAFPANFVRRGGVPGAATVFAARGVASSFSISARAAYQIFHRVAQHGIGGGPNSPESGRVETSLSGVVDGDTDAGTCDDISIRILDLKLRGDFSAIESLASRRGAAKSSDSLNVRAGNRGDFNGHIESIHQTEVVEIGKVGDRSASTESKLRNSGRGHSSDLSTTNHAMGPIVRGCIACRWERTMSSLAVQMSVRVDVATCSGPESRGFGVSCDTKG